MADSTPTQPQQPVFNIQRIYLKDASLEIPNAPQIFLENEAPNVEVQLDVSNALVLEGIHEVTVTVTVTTRVKEQVAFLVEARAHLGDPFVQGRGVRLSGPHHGGHRR